MAEGEALEKAASREAKGIIAKVVKNFVRDAEQPLGRAAETDATKSAGQNAAKDAERTTQRHVDLDALPDYHQGGQPDLFGSQSVPADYEPFGDLDRQSFYDQHWNEAEGHWNYPDNEGFAGPRTPNTLQPGDVVDRYGFPTGRFTSPADTPFEQRALPPTNLTAPYYRYQVTRALPDEVTEGRIAHAFEQPGGGVQHYFENAGRPVQWYVDHGYLLQVYP